MNLYNAAVAHRKGVGLLATVSVLLPSVAAAGLLTAAPAQAADSSTVTVSAAEQDAYLQSAPFPDLEVTVSQTTDLVSQGIRLTYSGGVQSTVPNNQIAGANFLQIVQCWGDLVDADGDPILDENGERQPDRTTCQYGSTGQPGQSRTATLSDAGLTAAQDESYMYPGDGWWDPPQVAIPFRSVTGAVLERIADGEYVSNTDLDNNEFFTSKTTNEVPWAGFGASGTGTATFEVQTNGQAPGLGCGQPIAQPDGSVIGQPCWLVVIPRGDHDLGETAITKSGLLWDNWKHRLAVRLDFKPLGVRCAIGAAERSLAGSELMTAAVGSWQPKLCTAQNGSVYNLIVANEADQALAANGTEGASLALTSRALAADGVTDNLTYAPVAVSGLTVAFAIDHRSDPLQSDIPDSVSAVDYQPFTSMNLTPRLVAKLLTDSYRTSLPTGADVSHLEDNPYYLWQDPDFLAVNDAIWQDQNLASPSHLADLLVPLGRSDSAWVVWQYILSDRDAVEFLAGEPDPWGMVVNPYSSTNAQLNPTGTGAVYPKDSFPKADPTSYTPFGMGEINLVGWRPYANDLDSAGYWVLRGDNRTLNQSSWDPIDPAPKYGMFSRDLAGSQRVIGLTDTAAAAKYQVFTASLLNPAGEFVAPTAQSMAAAANVMTPVEGQTQVRALDYDSAQVEAARDAYPLTVPIYAATNPASGDQTTRDAYSSFIRYAVGSGQTPGSDDGQLPAGYAPLPATWVTQATTAAAVIASGGAVTTADTTTASTTSPTGGGTTTVPPAADPAVETGNDPTATGETAGALTGAATPEDPDIGLLRAAVPVGAAGGLLAALGIPLVSRIRRER